MFTTRQNLSLPVASGVFRMCERQWRNDGVAAASCDGGPPVVRGPPTVPEFLMINFLMFVFDVIE